MTFDRLIQAYLAERQRHGMAACTLYLCTRWLSKFADFCREHQVETPLWLTPTHLDDFQHRLQWSPRQGGGFLSPNTIDQALRMVRACLRWAVDQGWLMRDPTLQMVLGRPIQPRQPLLTRDQVDRILNTPTEQTSTGMRNRALLALFYYLPVSTRQATILCVSHLELPDALHLPGPDGYQRLELEDELARRLERYLRLARPRLTLEREALFVSRNGSRLTCNRMEKTCSELGVCVRTLRRSFLAHMRELQDHRLLSPNRLPEAR